MEGLFGSLLGQWCQLADGWRVVTGERVEAKWPGMPRRVRPPQWQPLSEEPELGNDLGAFASDQCLRCQGLSAEGLAPTFPVLLSHPCAVDHDPLITLAERRPPPRQVHAMHTTRERICAEGKGTGGQSL